MEVDKDGGGVLLPSSFSKFDDRESEEVPQICYGSVIPKLLANGLPRTLLLINGFVRSALRSGKNLSRILALILAGLSCLLSLLTVSLLLSRHIHHTSSTLESKAFYKESLHSSLVTEEEEKHHVQDSLLSSSSSTESSVLDNENTTSGQIEKPILSQELHVVKALSKDASDLSQNEEPPVLLDNTPDIRQGSTDNADIGSQKVIEKEEDERVDGGGGEELSDVPHNLPENKTEDIPSFSEWTQKALEKEENDKKKLQQQILEDPNSTSSHSSLSSSGAQSLNSSAPSSDGKTTTDGSGSGGPTPSNGASTSFAPVVLGNRIKKNYAGPDCGAKVVGSNPEATGAKNIISSYRDEYMLNKCSDKVWFIIELCESIKAHRVEIANFELYSSVPKEFRVSLSNVYPSRDWTLFGTFKAVESRDIQVFNTELDNIYGKYVKVEVLSHHGSEHYCPVSLFRIFGFSEIELMAHDDEEPHHDHLEEEDLTVIHEEKKKNSGIVNFIKEKVDETIGRVVDVVFKSNKIKETTPSTNESFLLFENRQTPVYMLNCPQCNGTKFHEVALILTSELPFLERTLKKLPRLKKMLTISECFKLGFGSSSLVSACPRHAKLYDLYSLVYGDSRLIALCNVAFYKDYASQNSSALEPPSNSKKIKGNVSTCQEPKESVSSPAELFLDSITVDRAEAITSSEGFNEITNGGDSIYPTPVSREESGKLLTPTSTFINSDPILSTKRTTMLDLPDVVHVPPPASSLYSGSSTTTQEEPEKSNAVVGQRESVWQKLTNRIKSLERNVSFSSGYLEELSVRYKKQIEDLQLSVRQSAESLNSALKSVGNEKMERQKLESKIKELSSLLFDLSGKIDSISSWTFGTHILFIILEIFIGWYCITSTNRKSCCHRNKGIKSVEWPISPAPVINREKSLVFENQCNSTPCKRRHSFNIGRHISKTQDKRRRSLDFTKGEGSQMSRRQRRRIIQRKKNLNGEKKISDKVSVPTVKVVESISSFGIETSNMFGSLNSSFYDDLTPVKVRTLTICSEGQEIVDNNNEPSSANSSFYRRSCLRSKSTSPTRKTEAAKQREDFEKFDPDEFRNSHSPMPQTLLEF